MSRDDGWCKSEVGASVAVVDGAENNGDLAPVEKLGVTVGERQGGALDVALHSIFSENRTCRDWTTEGVCEELL